MGGRRGTGGTSLKRTSLSGDNRRTLVRGCGTAGVECFRSGVGCFLLDLRLVPSAGVLVAAVMRSFRAA